MPNASVTPEAVFESHPQLNAIRQNLVVENYDDPKIRAIVDQLAKISPRVLQRTGSRVRVHIANRPITDMIGKKRLAKQIPDGWTDKTQSLKDGRGVFASDKRIVAINPSRTGGSRAVGQHEYGHAVGQLSRLNNAPELIAANKRAFNKLPSYYKQGGPGELVGRREMLAEATAYYYTPLPGFTAQQSVAKFVDKEFADWLHKKLR
jgi:hypothetical protein